MLPRKPPWGMWVLITETVRRPLRVAARGWSSPGVSPSAPSPGLVSSSSLPLHRWQHDKVSLVVQGSTQMQPPLEHFGRGPGWVGKGWLLRQWGWVPALPLAASMTWRVSETLWASVSSSFINFIGLLWGLKSEKAQHNFDHVWNAQYLFEVEAPSSILSGGNCSSLCVAIASFLSRVTYHTVVGWLFHFCLTHSTVSSLMAELMSPSSLQPLGMG